MFGYIVVRMLIIQKFVDTFQ